MTSRPRILRSGLQLLIQDQKHVTAAFQKWSENELPSTGSIRSVVASVYRCLQRDLDRLYLLAESYDLEDDPEQSAPDAIPAPVEAEGQAPSDDRLQAVPSTVGEILQEGYEYLERLSTRYASVYCMASAVMEPAVANVTYSNLKGTRDLASDLMGTRALVTVEEVTAAHPSLVVNMTAGSRAGELMRTLWAPHDDGKDEPSYATLERNGSYASS